MGLFFTSSCTCLWIPLTADTDFYLLMSNANMLLKPKMCCDGEIKKNTYASNLQKSHHGKKPDQTAHMCNLI